MPPFDRPGVGDGPRISGRAVDGVVIVGRCLIGDVPGRRYRRRVIRRRIAEHDAVDVGSGDNDACHRIFSRYKTRRRPGSGEAILFNKVGGQGANQR